MNSKALRRLATDHGALHNQPLPPNYLFPPTSTDSDSLTSLDILLAGPTHTPYESGVFKLHLSIPPEYPQAPPTANFRTPIFHPNVESETGGVCVETLKRDWDVKLTLRDVLVTICCLLIQPNPDSALNADAGALIRDDYEAFARRARLMTSIHAVVPRALKEAVTEAQERGQEVDGKAEGKKGKMMQGDVLEGPVEHAAGGEPVRRRRTVARVRETMAARRKDASPTGAAAGRRRAQPGPSTSRPFTLPVAGDDIFGLSSRDRRQMRTPSDTEEDSIFEPNQENDEARTPAKPKTPATAATPRRPAGPPIPLGELTMEDAPPLPDEQEQNGNGWDTSEDMEPEYPPSPRKSPTKSPRKQRQQRQPAESSRGTNNIPDIFGRAPNITPPNAHQQPLAESSPFAPTAADTHLVKGNPTSSPRKGPRELFTPLGFVQTPGPPKFAFTPKRQTRAISTAANGKGKGISKPTPRRPSSATMEAAVEASLVENKRDERAAANERLWELCGRDVEKWNRGEFGSGLGWDVKAARW